MPSKVNLPFEGKLSLVSLKPVVSLSDSNTIRMLRRIAVVRSSVNTSYVWLVPWLS